MEDYNILTVRYLPHLVWALADRIIAQYLWTWREHHLRGQLTGYYPERYQWSCPLDRPET
jgi:hypothetical protein